MPYTLYVDITHRCHQGCPSCPKGRGEFNQVGSDIHAHAYHAILRHAAELYDLDSVVLYNYSDPMEYHDYPSFRYILMLNALFNIRTRISTPAVNVSNIETCTPNLVQEFIVSTSGLQNRRVNHPNLTVEQWLKNLVKIQKVRGKHVMMLFHQYDYNHDDERLIKAICREYGWKYLWNPGIVAGMEAIHQGKLESVRARYDARKVLEDVRKLKGPCPMHHYSINILNSGKLGLCGLTNHPVSNKPFTEMTYAEIESARTMDNSYCRTCLDNGYHRVCCYRSRYFNRPLYGVREFVSRVCARSPLLRKVLHITGQ